MITTVTNCIEGKPDVRLLAFSKLLTRESGLDVAVFSAPSPFSNRRRDWAARIRFDSPEGMRQASKIVECQFFPTAKLIIHQFVRQCAEEAKGCN